jgi:hypothetical protein
MKSRTKSKARACVQPEVQISMPMQGVVQEVQQAFYGLCIEAGLRVLDVMMEADREALCGPKGVPDAQRRAVRGGHTDIRRPRARALDSGELPLPTFTWAAGADPLNAATLAAVAAGVSTRRYASTLDPLPPKVRRSCASKSAVSRRFKELSQQQLDAWLRRPLDALDLPVIMIDGIHFADRVVLIALGIDDHAGKHILGIREGSSEAARVVTALLSDLIERGLDAQRPRLWGIDGGKALRRAITQTFGAAALIQRCQEHKRRNVLDHCPKALHASVNRALRDAWRRRQPARGPGGHADLADAGHHRLAVPHPAHHQPD